MSHPQLIPLQRMLVAAARGAVAEAAAKAHRVVEVEDAVVEQL